MLKVLKSGLFTTVQDAGRFGYLSMGVPIAGYMDTYSAQKVNQLLENKTDAAVIEITMTGPTLQFFDPTYICLGGAEISATLNNQPIEAYTILKIKEGDILSYGQIITGFRSYLAVKGGFTTPKVLGSRSYFLTITEKDHLSENAEISYDACSDFSPILVEMKVDSFVYDHALQVTKGPSTVYSTIIN